MDPSQDPPVDKSPEAHAQEFRERGYSVLPGLFSKQEVDRVREAIEEASQRMPGAGPSTKGAMVFYSNCFRYSDELQKLCADPRLTRYLRPLAGDSYWIRWDQCVAKGPGAPVFPWHQDNAYNGLKDEHFQVWIALGEMTEENGGVWFSPGSHAHGRLPHTKRGAHHVYQGDVENEELIAAQPGDVVFFSSLMLHHTRENRSETPRWAYVLEFMKAKHFDPAIEQPYLMVLEDGEPTLRWTHWFKGRLSAVNAVKYARWRMTMTRRRWLKGRRG